MKTMELVLAQLPTDLSVSAVGNKAAKDLQGRFGGRGSSWSREETSILLNVYEVEMAKEDANFDKNSPSMMVPKFQSIYRTISDVLTQHGFQRSPMQVRERLKRLKRDVREHKQGEFTARVSAIVGRSPYTRPSLIQQAALSRPDKERAVRGIGDKDRLEGYYPVADIMAAEISYPDDDEPTSDSPISMNAEVPEGASSETEHHDSSSSEHEESKSTRSDKQRVPSATGHSPTVIAAPKEKSSLSTSSSSSSMRSSPVTRTPPHTPTPQHPVGQSHHTAVLTPLQSHLTLHPPPTPHHVTSYPSPAIYATLEQAYKHQRLYKEELHNDPIPPAPPSPAPALPINLSLHQGMMFGLSPNMTASPAAAAITPSKSQTPVIQPPQRSVSPQCSTCSYTSQEQKRIHMLLQKIITDNKVNAENQMLFQRQMMAHLNCITYTLQGLQGLQGVVARVAPLTPPDSKRYSSSESHSNGEDNDDATAASPVSPGRDLN